MRSLVIPLIATIIIVTSTAPAHADLGDQLFKLLADDGQEIDLFGFSVAISGPTAIIGAPSELIEKGDNVFGFAYIFDTTTGKQLFKLKANDAAANDWFGRSVGISGTTAIVGAYGNDDHGSLSGSAYLFDTTTGQQITKLLPDDGEAGERFGIAVAISGTTAIISADFDDDNGPISGSAYLFDTTTGDQIAKILPEDGAMNDQFGRAVAICGNVAIVGVRQDDDNGQESGSAYLFDAITGKQLFKLLPDDGEAFDVFGWSVGVCGNIAVVGSPRDDDNGDSAGAVYLFDTDTGQQIAKLLPCDGAGGDNFGSSVGISGATAIVGSRYDNDNGTNSGSVYLFDTTTGQQIAKLLPNDGALFDIFGVSVAISGPTGMEIAIIGAHRDDDNGDDSGSAYIFDAGVGNCPWDLDNSGSVDTSDLLELFAQWGTAGAADFDGSGNVDTGDLLILFANWGSCQ